MSQLRSRDLSAARSAFASGDPAASMRAHSSESNGGAGSGAGSSGAGQPGSSEGGHANASNDVSHAVRQDMDRAATFGTASTLLVASLLSSVVASAAADAAPSLLIAACMTYVLAGGLLWTGTVWLDLRIESAVYTRERRRESWELTNYKAGEVREIVELYENRGMSHEDAVVAVGKMAKYHEFFVDVMMAEELALIKPISADEAPGRVWLAGVAFVLAGAAPVAVAVLAAWAVTGLGLVPAERLPSDVFQLCLLCAGPVLAAGVGWRKASHNMLEPLSLVVTHAGLGAVAVLLPPLTGWVILRVQLAFSPFP